jgi:hypothetical protein
MRDVKAAFLDGYRSVRELSSDLLLAEIASAYLVRWSELRSATRERPPALSSFARRRINAFMAKRIAQFLDHPSELATN